MATFDTAPLWAPTPERIASSRMAKFARDAAGLDPLAPDAYRRLHAWSLADIGRFWSCVWDACGVKGEKGLATVVDPDRMPGARFFPDAKLNLAENLIERGNASDEVMVFWGETGRRTVWTRRDLKDRAGRFASALAAAGLRKGDRVAALMPNSPETVAALLGTAWIGGTFASASPDFGVNAVVDRFAQIEPRVLVACAGYRYNGKIHDITSKIQEIKYRLPSVEAVVIVPYEGDARRLTGYPSYFTWNDFLAVGEGGGQPYTPVGFDHPAYILFSSGTTGRPKCIVHGTGRALIQHVKEQALHCDIQARDRVFYYTTCGWMMWNWLVSALGQGATLLLYDGSPFAQDGTILFKMAQEERASFLGLSAKYIDQLRKDGIKPKDAFDLGSIRMIASTGSPLAADNFRYIYESIKSDVHLASISGGTDIVSCFTLGNPLTAVYPGEIQGPGLGMAVEIWNEDGAPQHLGAGELVCTRPFPSMPVSFWNDPDGAKYQDTYFSAFRGVWRHGDWAEATRRGGVVIHGRSDATLNPGGVRIGTAEITNPLETLDEIVEAVAVGQEWDGDVRVLLFVRLRDGIALDKALEDKIRLRIRAAASPRHVPAKIVPVSDIPRTKTGKVTELAIRDIIHGREPKNADSLANPSALAQFRALPELQAA